MLQLMPEISRFYGIIIQNLSVLEGRIPPRALGLVIEWASIHQTELIEGFALAQQMQKPPKIAPLP
jgi:hypothetical protein